MPTDLCDRDQADGKPFDVFEGGTRCNSKFHASLLRVSGVVVYTAITRTSLAFCPLKRKGIDRWVIDIARDRLFTIKAPVITVKIK